MSDVIWRKSFDDRSQKEIAFCECYRDQFNHGTGGHNGRLVIAGMAAILDLLEELAPAAVTEVIEILDV